jgi:hypothetical protein
MTVNKQEFRGPLEISSLLVVGSSATQGRRLRGCSLTTSNYSRLHNSWHFVDLCPKAEAAKRDKIPGLRLHFDQIVLIDV